MQIIGTILNIFFIVVLLLCMGIGFLSGMWKRLRSLVGLVIGILLLIILINPIAKGIVNMNIPGVGRTVTDIVMEELTSGMENGSVIPIDGEVALLCNSVALTLAKMAVLLIGTTLIFSIIVPITLIVARIIFGKDKHEKTLGIRFAGMGIAAVELLVGFFLITLPIFGTTSLIMRYEDVLKESDDTQEIIEVVEIIDNSVPGKIGKIFGPKAQINTLGAFTKTKNKNGTLNIYKEIYNAEPIVKVILEKDSKYEGDTLKAVIANKEEVIEFIKNTDILETFMPAVLEILEANESLDAEVITELKKIDLANDKTYLADILNVVLDFIEATELDLEDPTKILSNPALPNALKELGEALKETTFADLLLDLLQDTMDNALSESQTDLSELLVVLDVTRIEKGNLPSDLYQIGVIANSIYNVGLLEENPDLLAKPEELKKLINAVLDISLVKGNEANIIDALLEMSGLKESLSELNVELNYTDINWEEEKVALGNIVDAIAAAHKNIPEFDFGKITEYIKNDKERGYIVKIISSLMESSLIGENFVTDFLFGEFNDVLPGVVLSEFDINKVQSWENELNAIFELVTLVEDGFDVENMTEAELQKIVLIAAGTKDEPCYLTSYILGSIINNALKETLSDNSYNEFIKNHDLTAPDDLRGSAKDIISIIALSKIVVEEPEFENWTDEEIKDLCDEVASLNIKDGTVTTTVLYEMINETGANVTKEEIINADLEKESAYLEDILKAIQTGKSDSEIEKIVEEVKENTTIISAIIDQIYEK